MTNKWLYSWIAFGVLVVVLWGVWVYNSGCPPNVMEHSAEEIGGIPVTKLVHHSLESSVPDCPAGWNKI